MMESSPTPFLGFALRRLASPRVLAQVDGKRMHFFLLARNVATECGDDAVMETALPAGSTLSR
jgi:hypothetical protein